MNLRDIDLKTSLLSHLQEYFFINTTAWNNIKWKRGQYLSDLFCVITFTTFGLVL